MVAAVPALVFGTGITTLGVMRSLSSRGVKCYGLSRGLQFVATSRHCKSLAGIRLGHLESDALVSTLTSLPVERAVLIACGDQWNMALANLPEELNGRFPRSQPSAELQRSLTDKASLSEILTTAAVPHPETIILRSPRDFESLPDEFFLARLSEAARLGTVLQILLGEGIQGQFKTARGGTSRTSAIGRNGDDASGVYPGSCSEPLFCRRIR